MKESFKLLTLLIFFTLQGCQLLTDFKSPFNDSVEPKPPVKAYNQDQMFQLLTLDNQYSSQTKKQQQVLCKQLKQQYKIQKDWRKAWLLTYALNNDFNCINLPKSLSMLKDIQASLDPSSPLYWLNNKHIHLLKTVSYFQSKNKKLKRKNRGLKDQLNEVEVHLQEITSKIQALKVIETTINQKTQ